MQKDMITNIFTVETINGTPQEDTVPAASQVINVVKESGEINYRRHKTFPERSNNNFSNQFCRDQPNE